MVSDKQMGVRGCSEPIVRQAVEYALFQANGKPVDITDLRPEIVAPFSSTLPSELAQLNAGDLSKRLLDIIQAVFEQQRCNRAATMRQLFPGMKESYFGRLAWDLVKMNPGLLDSKLPEGQRFSQFNELKQAYFNAKKSREKIKNRNHT